MVRGLDCQTPLSEQHQGQAKQHQTMRKGSSGETGNQKDSLSWHALDLYPDPATSQEVPGSPDWPPMGCMANYRKVCAGVFRPRSQASGIYFICAPSAAPHPLSLSGMISWKTNALSFLEYFSWYFFPPKVACSAAMATQPCITHLHVEGDVKGTGQSLLPAHSLQLLSVGSRGGDHCGYVCGSHRFFSQGFFLLLLGRLEGKAF